MFAFVCSVLYDSDHLSAPTIVRLVITAQCVGNGAEEVACKLLVDHCRRWRILVVMPREIPPGQQHRACGREVFGGDAVQDGTLLRAGMPEIQRGLGPGATFFL